MSTPENGSQGPEIRPPVEETQPTPEMMDPLERENLALNARIEELEAREARLNEAIDFMRTEVARELLSVAQSLGQSSERLTALAEMLGSITTETPNGAQEPDVVNGQNQDQQPENVSETRVRGSLPPAVTPERNGNKQERRGRRWLTTAVAVGALAVGVAAGFILDKDNNGKVKTQATEQVANKNSEQAAATAASQGSEAVRAFAAGELEGTMQQGAAEQKAAAVAAAKERAQARAEARVKARVAMLSNVRDAKTVPFAAKRLISTPDTVNTNVRWIHSNNVEKQLLHPRGEMSSIDEAFNPHTLNDTNAKELLAFSFEGSTGYAMASYQAAHGGAETSPEAAQAWLNKKLASAEGNVRVSDALKGQVRMNHGQRGENVFAAGEFKIKGPVVLFDTGDVTLVYKLDNNGCLNLLTKIKNKTTSTTPSSTTQTPSGGNPKTKLVSGPTSGKGKGHGNGDGDHHKKITPKTDDAKLPGDGTPASQDKGTPDKAGKGPAGQTPGADGFVPGEDRPATPAPVPTPEPLPNKPAPSGPAQEGSSTNAPQEQAQGSETPAPTTNPDPQG